MALSDITKANHFDSTRLRNGYCAEGLAVLPRLFNTFPYTGFSQNVGLVKLSGIKTSLANLLCSGFLVLLLDSFLSLVPCSIIQAQSLVALCLLCSVLLLDHGMQILARVDFANNEHNFLIAAVSIAAGVGLNEQIPLQQLLNASNVLLKTVSSLQVCLPSSSMPF